MPIPEYGAAPLAKTFVLVRVLSLVSMIAVVGMTANFVAQIISSNVDPPKEIIGTLVVTCLASFYALISLPLFYANANLGLLIMAVIDFLLLLAFIIVSVLLGKPLSFLNCMVVDNATAAANAQSAAVFTQALAANFNKSGSTLGLESWAGSTRANCLETKAIWGLGIALSVLFACSTFLLPVMWMKARKAAAGGGKEVA